MPAAHRRHRPRAHRRTVPLEFETEPFALWLPDPDAPVLVENFGDAASLAFDLLELPAQREMLVLIDKRRAVTAVVVDPPAPVGVFISGCEIPGLEVPFCQTLSLVLVDRVDDGPPSNDDRLGYLALRRFHMLQGLQLLDVIMVDGERVRSLSIACDPDPVWFESDEPVESGEPVEPGEPGGPAAA